MIDLVLLVASVALVDSLNPTTLVPALYLATGRHPVRGVLGFALGVFVVNATVGAVLLLVGNRVAGRIPRPAPDLVHWGEVVVGIVLIVAAVILWRRRAAVGAGFARVDQSAHRYAPLAGAAIAGIELPTAVPYLAVLAALAASRQTLAFQFAMVVLFNVLFLLPVLAIALVRALAGDRAVSLLGRLRELALRYGGSVLAGLLLALGVILLLLGAVGLAGVPHLPGGGMSFRE